MKRNKREDPAISFKRILSVRGDVYSDVDDTEDPNWSPVNSPLHYDLQQSSPIGASGTGSYDITALLRLVRNFIPDISGSYTIIQQSGLVINNSQLYLYLGLDGSGSIYTNLLIPIVYRCRSGVHVPMLTIRRQRSKKILWSSFADTTSPKIEL